MQDKAKILIVDDEEQMQRAMETVVARLGHTVLSAGNGEEAMQIVRDSKVDMIISDMRMPVMTGDQLLETIHREFPKLPMVMITAYGTITQAVDAMRNGAFDFITKPFSADDLESAIERALSPSPRLAAQKEALQSSESGRDSSSRAIVTNDAAFKRVLEIAITIANSSASVLVQGESGTGKELIARLIHTSSDRRNNPFVAVNCAALPENLLESELFGHEKGSFTGAVGTKIGKFELAQGGTLLLDEVSEMEPLLQAKLLRVLQEREIDRVGGSKPIPINVRVVATTNRDIRESVAKGEFREDLYYRLNVVPLHVPPLRERRGDIKLLLEHFIRKFSTSGTRSIPASVLAELETYAWPGNIRELQNGCERAVLLAGDGEFKADYFLLGALAQAAGGSSTDDLRIRSGLSVADAERKLIFETLKSTGNNKTKAAELLGISIRTLRNKLHEYNGDDSGFDGFEGGAGAD